LAKVEGTLMKHITTTRRILIGALLCLFSCVLAVVWARGKPSGTKPTPKAASALRLELKALAPLTSSRMTTITARFHNTSSRLIEGAVGDTITRGFTIRVLRGRKAVPLTAYARKHQGPVTFARPSFAVAPKGTLTFRLAVGALYDMSEEGVYTVEVSYLLDPYTREAVAAKPLTVVITPAPLVSPLPMSAKDQAAVDQALVEAARADMAKAKVNSPQPAGAPLEPPPPAPSGNTPQ